MSAFFDRLKTKWGIKNNFQIILILVVFSLSGSSALLFKPFYYALVGVDENTPNYIKAFWYILLLFPTYQVLLLTYGFLLGQFAFFWDKEKKMFRALFRIGKKKEKEPVN